MDKLIESEDEGENISHVGIYILKHFISFLLSIIIVGGFGIIAMWIVSEYIISLSIVEFDTESTAAARDYLILMIVAIVSIVLYEKIKLIRNFVSLIGSVAWLILSKTLFVNKYSTDSEENQNDSDSGETINQDSNDKEGSAKQKYENYFGPIFLMGLFWVALIKTLIELFTGIISNLSTYAITFLLVAGLIQLTISLIFKPLLVVKNNTSNIEWIELISHQIQSLFVIMSVTAQMFEFMGLNLTKVAATVVWLGLTVGLITLIAYSDRIIFKYLNNINITGETSE